MKIFHQIKANILDTLFPVSCLICGHSGRFLCHECLSKIEIFDSQVCPYCEKTVTDAGRVCLPCRINSFLKKRKTVFLDRLIIATQYKIISRLVYAFKYNFIKDLSVPLGKLLKEACFLNNLPMPDFIVPVPLHKRRERWRGFNQSRLLADEISKNLSPGYPIPVLSDLIVRKRHTQPQMKIKDYGKRVKNIQSAFSLMPSELNIENKNIFLVDDICTTGSTLTECAKVLKSAGAETVNGLVLARQELALS